MEGSELLGFACGHGLREWNGTDIVSGRNELCTRPSPSIFMRIDRCAGRKPGQKQNETKAKQNNMKSLLNSTMREARG